MTNNVGAASTQRCVLTGEITVPKVVGTADYNKLYNLPQIESITLQGNKTFEDLGMTECTNQEIIDMFK